MDDVMKDVQWKKMRTCVWDTSLLAHNLYFLRDRYANGLSPCPTESVECGGFPFHEPSHGQFETL